MEHQQIVVCVKVHVCTVHASYNHNTVVCVSGHMCTVQASQTTLSDMVINMKLNVVVKIVNFRDKSWFSVHPG